MKSILPVDVEVINGDYSVIQRPGSGGAMQLDIHIPAMAFAIEVNGEYYHDREAYENDLKMGTCESREALKDLLCEEQGVRLIHIWCMDWKNKRGLMEDLIAKELRKINTSPL